MSARRIAEQDQLDAKEREFDRRAARVARWLLAVAFLVGLYGTLALFGILPALPWSPLGRG